MDSIINVEFQIKVQDRVILKVYFILSMFFSSMKMSSNIYGSLGEIIKPCVF